MSEKGNIAVVLLIVGLVVLGIGVGAYMFTSQDKNSNQNSKDVSGTPSELNMDMNKTETSMEENQATLVATLEDVSGGELSGMGYILRSDELLVHKVEATLPDPEGDNFYEGWLVKQEPELNFFSTGEMVKGIDGKYNLDYESGTDYAGYDFVVITLETTKDITPEKHILEGLAK